jgi:pyruvate/2-oxoglutarate dehydrogenase complex dihydrolipoamide acyltransferase (E2) component
MAQRRYRVEKVPVERRSAFDAGRLARHRNIVHALIELDLSRARQIIRTHREQTGERLSLTAFLIKCLGKAISVHPHLHAYMDWRRRLLMYEDVSIVAMIEVKRGSGSAPMPHTFREVNTRSLQEIHDELRAAQENPSDQLGWGFIRTFQRFPGILRGLLYWIVRRFPQSFRRYSSTVMVTSVGMFGRAGGWGVPRSGNTLTVTVGGISKKPRVIDGEIAIREVLDLTLSFDHDVVDGAPAARFSEELRRLVEEAYGLAQEFAL